MKTAEKINNLIRAGVPCELAEKVVHKGFSLSKVKEITKSELSSHFTDAETAILFDLKRQPIPQEIVDRLFNESAARCCLCWQWDAEPPLIIHHIEEHSKTQDDSYENLVLLCLNHHAEVHTVSKLSRQKNPPIYVRSQKSKWVHAVSEYQAGRRPKPGTEKTRRIYKPIAPPQDLQFVGREKVLNQVTKLLQKNKHSVLAISGMGGVGKTALAKKAIEQVGNDYTGGVFWASLSEVNGEITSIFNIWATICGNIFFENEKATDLVYLIRNILTTYTAEHGRILIVIDDIREEWLPNARLLRSAAPQNCSILLTTRNKEIAKTLDAQLINLGEMLPDEAVEMFRLFVEASLVEQEILLVEKLLEELGYLPLAIELAGKRIGLERYKPGFSLEIFLREVHSRAAAKLIIKGHQGLIVTFSITYDNLEPQYQAVFRKIGIFATNLFSVDQVAAMTDLHLENTESILDDMVMQSLLQWGYIEGEYIIHPLLKQFSTQLFSGSSSDEQKLTQNRYIDFFVNYAADNGKGTVDTHQVLDRIWPDIQQTFDFVVENKDDKAVNRLANILCLDSRFLYVRGYVQESVHILTKAIQACRHNGWKEDEVGHLIEMGTAYNHLGETENSICSYQTALNLSQQLQNPKTDGACLHNLGLICYDIGRIEQATTYFVQALDIAEEYHDIHLAADVLSSLGGIQRSLGDIKNARYYYNGALKIARMLEDRLREGNVLSNLGLTYYDEQDYETARKYIDQGLIIARDISDHRGEANRLGHLGNICNQTNNPKQGITYYTEAVAICRAISHRINEGNWLGNMGNSYRLLGEFDRAVNLLNQALDISREVQSGKQEIIWLLNLGYTFRDTQKWDQAIKHLEDAALVSGALRDYKKYQIALNNLVSIYAHLGKIKELKICYEKQLKASQEVGDLETAGNLLNQIGELLLHSGSFEEAKVHFEQALILSKQLQNKSLEGICLSNLALYAKNISDFDKAIELYQQAISCFHKTGNKIGEGIAIGELGVVYLQIGQIAKAIDGLNSAYAIFQRTKFVPKYAFTLGNLGNAYYTQGEIETAIEYHKLALEISQSLHDNLNVANWMGALGHDYLNLEDYDKAKELYTQCILISRQTGIPFLEAYSLQGLGIVYRVLSHIKLSDQNLQKSLALSRKLNDKLLQAGCLRHIGINLIEEGKVNEAQLNFEHALLISRQINSRTSEAMTLWELGKLNEIKKPEVAFQYMSHALLIFEECGISKDEYITKIDEVKAKLAG